MSVCMLEQHSSRTLFDGTRHSWDGICNNLGNFACPPQFLTAGTEIKNLSKLATTTTTKNFIAGISKHT
jgi:hypothetical protein